MTSTHSKSDNPPLSINAAVDQPPSGRIVDRDCSLFGLQRLHVMHLGLPDDLDAYRDEWVIYAVQDGTLEAVLRYYDEDIQIYHLRLYWRNDGRKTVEMPE